MTKKSKPASTKTPKAAAPVASAPASAAAGGKIAKAQLVDMVADKTSLTKVQSEGAVSAMLDAVVRSLQGGQSVGLPGLGTLNVKETAARTGVKPGTSEKIQIPAGKKVSFKVASTLKGEL
ncbi:HU family DNA-binding protein [Deinococcus marmoris]|uniref:Integration host factor alpha subunit n=1 Tax=Deinococcus marmoris TaxID=249408 RepID=A0A1U7NWN5_9DEIO|nr:HU family DNA-binding protein [Deinococcus marmoris]OLV17324.1 Integration host factor alpha subunit [Deinococcus marmoris]